MSELLATVLVERPEHLFILRQTGRAVAEAMGCDEASQVRLATALSELARETLTHERTSTATFGLREDGVLVIELDHFPSAESGRDGRITGLDAARRLVEDVAVSRGDNGAGITVTLRRPPPGGRSHADAGAIRAVIARTASLGSLDELRLENRNLIATLEELKTLNRELEETNRGVMAMYTQLTEELDETNRGVVALYAELDDKTVQLKTASEAKSRFLHSVSHELRSPVNSILGLGKLLLDPKSQALTTDQRRQLELITQSAAELLRLVNDLLDLAKAESGGLAPEMQRVELDEMFAELRGALRPLARPGVALVVQMPGLAIETDRTLLMRVLRNLLANALKFTKKGSVRLSAELTAPFELKITVADTGIGIAPEDHERIFEEFFQVKSLLQAEHKGTGLGLPYARRVTQALGGEIRVESELGRGSVFSVCLPTKWQRLLRAAESPGRRAPIASKSVGTVLIVDDDESFRSVLRGMLQNTAQQVIEARGGVEGLQLMRSAHPNLTFLDLRMPDMDGAEVLAQRDADPSLAAVPVILVSSATLNPGKRFGSAAAILSKSEMNEESVQTLIAEVLGAGNGHS